MTFCSTLKGCAAHHQVRAFFEAESNVQCTGMACGWPGANASPDEETAITAESFPKIMVCLLTVGQSIKMFITMHPSPSFVVVVVQ